MKKNKLFLLLVLSISLMGCGKGNSSSSSISPHIPQYGEETLPPLPVLVDDEYEPEGLSEKTIVKDGITHAPMDLLSQELTITFDPVAQSVEGHSAIKFRVKKAGRPYFELKATPKAVQANAAPGSMTSIKDPDGQAQTYWSVDKEFSPGETHEVSFEYSLPAGRVSFTDGGVRFLTDMTDLSGKFFEYWGPVGFEEDAFTLNLELKVLNSESTHMLKTNGSIVSSDSKNWKINFPNYYSKSSFYVHLTNQTTLPSKSFVYKGLEKDIPIEVYGLTSTLVNSAVTQLPKLFAELEKAYGPYAHDKFLAYMNDRSGGMEYVGATITSLGSLDHELLHSWFARSVIPADGRSGWIDEAMASWRDYGYTQAKTTLNRTPTNMTDYSPFKKSTPSNSYVDGRGLMSELDLMFSDFGGLKPVMKVFFERYKNKIVTNEEFWKFLEEYTKLELDAFNTRYALGRSNEDDNVAEELPEDPSEGRTPTSKHPTPLTETEILRLR